MLHEILWVSIIGAFINLDEHTMIQSMICRPIVACPVIGCLLGDIKTGFILGILLELILFNSLPVGATTPLNSSVTAVILSGLCILVSQIIKVTVSPALMVFIMVFAIPTGILFKYLEISKRKLNIIIAHAAEKSIINGRLKAVEWATYAGILTGYIIAFVYILVFMLMGTYFLPKLLTILPEWVMEELNYAFMFIFTLGIAVVANTFRVRLWKKN